MKYIVVLGDGMADVPTLKLDRRTPLEAADIPNMDFLARNGLCGLARTIPEGMSPGSDTANLSVLGYDPRTCYTGRSPLEAASMGIKLADDDIAFRCNLVTLSDEPSFSDKTMLDYSAGEITTEEARELVEYLRRELIPQYPQLELYPGISYRHCLVLHGGSTGSTLTPPHDFTGGPVAGRLPGGAEGELLIEVMRRSHELLRSHPVNLSRIERGLPPANSCWFWGEGTRPSLRPFSEEYGVEGGMVCAVDLLRGIAVCAGMRTAEVEGATGGMTTNYRGKCEAALEMLHSGCDLVYIHVEAPDECGHHGEAQMKVNAIEAIDREIVARILEELDGEDFSILLTPDHPTPLDIRTHSPDPVPFVIYRSREELSPHASCYTEAAASSTGILLPEGRMLMRLLLGIN